MTNKYPLSLLEEFLLLALDPQNGQLYPLDELALSRAVTGAVLMDLSLRNRIDNDLHDVFMVDPTPTGDDILDPLLEKMVKAPVLTPHSLAYWLQEMAGESAALKEKALLRLEKRGLIRHQTYGFFWIFGAPQGTKLDEGAVREVKSHLLSVIYGNDVPSPHGIMLTGLVESCGLFRFILNDTEAKDAAARIAEVSRMDLISQAIAKDFANTEPTRAVASGKS